MIADYNCIIDASPSAVMWFWFTNLDQRIRKLPNIQTSEDYTSMATSRTMF